MESLEIKNFLTIREARLDVKRFTIIIGPQANGKSVIAKLLYFFRDFLNTTFVQSAQSLGGKRELQRMGVALFEQLFPSYSWSDQEFSICYRSNEYDISLVGSGSKGTKIHFNFSDNLTALHHRLKKRYKEVLIEDERDKEAPFHTSRSNLFAMVLQESIYTEPVRANFRRSIFIPASRSFFANLQKNVFSFLANSLTIDPLIKEFGAVYESARTQHNRPRRRSVLARRTPEAKERERVAAEQHETLQKDIKNEIERIIAGEYVYEDDQDWIVSQRRKINLVNASSGQQEALPLLIVLKAGSNVLSSKARPMNFFIEEPEAHLFPTSQRRLVEIFSRLYNEQYTNFFLTTHSPYILTALNNLITASNLSEKESNRERVNAVVKQNNWLSFEDVGAYTIREGQLQSILDEDLRIIGPTVIDTVSDEFDRVFDKLMEIEVCHEAN